MKPPVQLGHAALAVFFALLPAASVGGALALAVLICAAGAVAFRPALIRQLSEKKQIFLALLTAFTIWTVGTTLWSPLPWDDQVPKLIAMVPLGSVFVAAATADLRARSLSIAAAIAGAVVLAALLAIEARSGMTLNRAAMPDEDPWQLLRHGGRGTTVLLALVWPAVGGLLLMGGHWRLTLGLVLVAAAGWLSLQFEQAANAAAFLVGLLAFLAAYIAPRQALFATTGAITAWLLVAPFVAKTLHRLADGASGVPFSWAHRTAIWDYVSERILERPVLGHGLEASRAVTDRIIVQERAALAIPVHPHSASLQVWFETGLIGALIASVALVVAGFWLARAFASNRSGAAAACATLASLAAVANISYSLWAEWWVATMFIAAALVGALTLPPARPAP